MWVLKIYVKNLNFKWNKFFFKFVEFFVGIKKNVGLIVNLDFWCLIGLVFLG